MGSLANSKLPEEKQKKNSEIYDSLLETAFHWCAFTVLSLLTLQFDIDSIHINTVKWTLQAHTHLSENVEHGNVSFQESVDTVKEIKP